MKFFISKQCWSNLDCENIRNVCKLIEKFDLVSFLITLDYSQNAPRIIMVVPGWVGHQDRKKEDLQFLNGLIFS